MSIRIATSLRSDLAEAAAKLKFSEHDTMRLAMEIGIKHFRAIDYDLAGAVLTQAGLTPKLQPQPVKPTGPIANPIVVLPSNITQLNIAADAPADNSDTKRVSLLAAIRTADVGPVFASHTALSISM